MVCKKNRTRVHNSAHDHIITPLNLSLGGPRQGRRHSSLTEKNQNVSQKKKKILKTPVLHRQIFLRRR